MKYQVCDLLKYHFSDEEIDHYAILLSNKERYVVHWLDTEGNPNDEYIVEWFEKK
jgi:succinate dehydrogenase flavin-adding protein (antitoxin of CptAB toxin-antitoxin module)